MTSNYLTDVKMDYWQGRTCKKIKNVVTENDDGLALKPALSAAAAGKLYDGACNLIEAAITYRDLDEGKALARKWFSQFADLGLVNSMVDELATYLRNHRLKVRFSRDKQLLGAYDPSFHVAGVVQMGKGVLWKRYTWGEKVMTFLHELSHAVLGTRDLADGSVGFKLGACYGPYAFRLAKGDLNNIANSAGLNTRDAIKNAENWGYYLVSHFKLLQQKLAPDMMPVLFGYTDFGRLEDEDLNDLTSYLKDRPDSPPEMSVSFGAGPKYDEGTYVAEITDR